METKRLFELNSFWINDREAEQIFRETCSWYESKFSTSDQISSQAYQEYINNYHKIKSLYFVARRNNNRTELIVFDTESEIEEVKILKTLNSLNRNTCLTLAPSGELFGFCSFFNEDKALIIDRNYEVRFLPSNLPLFHSSAIYFNANIYCFGGKDEKENRLKFSRKFDLNKNRWKNLTPMPQADYYCHSVIFKGNILICGYYNWSLLVYSVDIDSFTKIPYYFYFYDGRKILINAERLYLIECFGVIYESEVENEYIWNQISNSVIKDNCPDQVYCVYNKGGIYISTETGYFKFDLKEKVMVKS